MSGFAIDMSGFKTFAKKLKVAEPRLQREFHASLVEAGDTIAERAREIAGEHSESIPPTIRTRVRGVNISIVAGNAATPLAGLYEVGNKGGGRGDSFRHPVFGDTNTWVEQPRFQFLRRAVTETRPLFVERVRFAVATVLQDITRSS